MKHGRIAAGSVAAFLALGGAGIPVPAALGATREAAVRIDISGRQRMLSQRMAKASCFVMIDVAAKAHQAEALKAADEFEAALGALQLGSDTFGFRPETDPQTLELMQQVSQRWASYGAAVRQLASGETYSLVVTQIMQQNIPVLKTMNAAVQRITSTNPVPGADPAMAKTINLAGRQRMLTQKMAKEFCFVVADISAPEMRMAL